MKKNKKILNILIVALIVSISSTSLTACNSSSSQVKNKEEQKQEEQIEKNDTKTTSDNEGKVKTTESSKTDKTSDISKKDQTKKSKIIYYTYDTNVENLIEKTASVDEVSVGNIIKAMTQEGVLQKGTDVNKAKIENINGVKTLVVDVNSSFINSNQGSGTEALMLRAFTNSLVKSFHVQQVKLTVDGSNYSSGHIIIEDGEYLKYK